MSDEGDSMDYAGYTWSQPLRNLEKYVHEIEDRQNRVGMGLAANIRLVQDRVVSLEKVLDGQLQHLYPWITGLEAQMDEVFTNDVDIRPPAQTDEAMDKLSERLADLDAQCATELYNARRLEERVDLLLGRVQTLEEEQVITSAFEEGAIKDARDFCEHGTPRPRYCLQCGGEKAESDWAAACAEEAANGPRPGGQPGVTLAIQRMSLEHAAMKEALEAANDTLQGLLGIFAYRGSLGDAQWNDLVQCANKVHGALRDLRDQLFV